jgi:hypothetical protein
VALSVILEELRKAAPDMDDISLLYLTQNCVACLNDQGHPSGVVVPIEQADVEHKVTVHHSVTIDQKFLNTYCDLTDRIDAGACAVAILVSMPLLGYKVVQRSRKYNGYDYRLGNDDDELPLNGGPKLEVSGLQKANANNSIADRVNDKIRRLRRFDAKPPVDTPNQPTYIFVLDFGQPRARMVVYDHSA